MRLFEGPFDSNLLDQSPDALPASLASAVANRNVRVASIRPQVNSRDRLSLDMTPPTRNDPFNHYRLSVNYAQKL